MKDYIVDIVQEMHNHTVLASVNSYK